MPEGRTIMAASDGCLPDESVVAAAIVLRLKSSHGKRKAGKVRGAPAPGRSTCFRPACRVPGVRVDRGLLLERKDR